MPQLNAQLRTNTTRVIDCLEFILADGGEHTCRRFNTQGIVVDRDHDPTVLFEDRASVYREKGTLIRIKVGDMRAARAGSGSRELVSPMGGTNRTEQTIELICAQTLSAAQKDKRITMDQISDWLRHDVVWGLANDPHSGESAVVIAAAELNSRKGVWGDVGTFGGPPSCMSMKVEQGLAGSIITGYDVYTTYVVTYLYDETFPGVAGH